MYQLIGGISDPKVAGLEPLLNYMSENFFTKDGPASNEHHYHIAKKQYNEEANNIYNIGKSKTLTLIMIHFYLDNLSIKTNVNNNIINNKTNKHSQ